MTNFVYFKTVGLEIFEKLLSTWPVYSLVLFWLWFTLYNDWHFHWSFNTLKSKFGHFKTEFDPFQWQAPGNPGCPNLNVTLPVCFIAVHTVRLIWDWCEIGRSIFLSVRPGWNLFQSGMSSPELAGCKAANCVSFRLSTQVLIFNKILAWCMIYWHAVLESEVGS